MDRAGQQTRSAVETFNDFVLKDLWPNFLPMYRGNYSIFGSPVMFTKVMWDTSFYWALPSQLLFRKLLTEPDALREFHPIALEFHELQLKMQQCFRDWAAYAKGPSEYTFVEYSKVPICAELHLDLLKDKTRDRCFADMRRNLGRLREWSNALAKEVYGTPSAARHDSEAHAPL
jgi:hypothetical protein